MKNKGFTLVEILAVITIIALLSLILIPSIDAIIKSSKEDTYKIQVNLILGGLENWAANNVFKLPSEEDDSMTITLGDLKKAGFVDVEVRNPKTDECFSNDLVLKITKKNNKYKYEIDESTLTFYSSDTCEVIN